MKLRVVGAAGALTLATVPVLGVSAQESDPYASCGLIEGDQERLACFDRTLERETQRRAEAAVVEEEEFGFTATQLSRRESEAEAARESAAAEPRSERAAGDEPDDAEEEEQTVNSRVAEVFLDGRRRAVILLENGQLWRETSNSNFRRNVRVGWDAEITTSITGGYRMKFDGQRGYLGVARVR